MTEALGLEALKKSTNAIQAEVRLTHLADRSDQYADKEYRRVLRHAEIRLSTNRDEDCNDNAFMESCL